MTPKELYTVLECVYASNFVAYQKTHSAHINTRGRNFYSDHKLLKHIYKFLRKNIDTLGEEIQACGVGRVPESIAEILETSRVDDAIPGMTADELLQSVLDDLYIMIDVYHEMDEAGREANYPDVCNMAADHIQKTATFCWMLESTLEVPGRHSKMGRNMAQDDDDSDY